MEKLEINVELSGGLELLFENKKNIKVEMPQDSNIADLILELKDNYLKENPELFCTENSV